MPHNTRKLAAGDNLSRIATLDTRAANPDTRQVPAALSSEIGVSRYFGTEILVHEPDSVDLTRAADGLPLLWQHNQDQPIGLVRDVRLEGRKLRGTLHFSNNPRAAEVFSDVESGFLKNISIGYRIDKWEESSDSDEVRVTGWTLMEASIVSVPADHTVGVNRAQPGDIPMPDEIKPDASGKPEETNPVVDLAKMGRDHRIAKKAGAQEAIKGERQRIADIHELFDLDIIPRNDFYAGVRARAVDEGWSVDVSRKVLMEMLSGEVEPAVEWGKATDSGVRVATHENQIAPVVMPPKPSNQRRVNGVDIQAGEDALTKFRTGATEALLVRGGIITDREAVRKAAEGGMVGVKLTRLAEQYLRLNGVDTANLDDEGLASRAFVTRASGQTTSDFTNILANVSNKSLLMGWDEAPEVWSMWTRPGNLSDFKVADRPGLSGFSSLDEIPEDGDIGYGKFADRKETIRLVEYAKKYRISRRTLINDEVNAFTTIPRAMGRAASRKVGDVVYAVINGVGPTLNQDNLALFHATHGNYTLAATAPTVATLEVARAAMARKTDPNSGATLNIRGRYLLVPVALETTARTLVASQYDPTGTAGTLTPNPFNGSFTVIADARMDSQTNGATAWVMAADPNVYDTVEVAFLNGVQQPYIREEEEWDTRGVEYVVGIDCGVAVLDFRGMHKYRGS